MKIPTLDGMLETPEEICDYLLGNFYANKNLQSTISQGSIPSLSFLIAAHRTDYIKLQSSVRDAIEAILENLYEIVELDVVVQDSPEDSQTIKIRFNCTIRYEGRSVSVGHLVSYVDGRLRSIQNIE